MKFPHNFDANEWYITITGLLILTIISFLPKRFPHTLTFLIILYNFYLATSIDRILAGTPLNLYNIMDDPKFEVYDLIIYVINYPPSAYLFLYIIDKYKLSTKQVILFIIIWCAGIVGLEWISIQFNVYQFIKWKLSHSYFMYIAIFLSNYFIYRSITHLFKKQTTS